MTLRSKDRNKIKQMFDRFQSESRSILNAVVNDVYYMRGSIQYKEMLDLPIPERDAITKFLKEHLENEAKKPPVQIY